MFYKLTRKFYLLFTLALITLSMQSVSIAQEDSKLVSGEYDSLILGVDSIDEVTGYFSDSTGIDEKGNPRFSCTFFLQGVQEGNGIYSIRTWFPEFPDEVINGRMFVTETDKSIKINIKLDGEHGGCWNVAPVLKNEEGLDFTLSSKGNWQSVRMISKERVYLFKSFDAGAPQKIYVVKNDLVRVLQTKDDFAEIVFISAKGKTTKGWVKTSSFYGIEP